MRKHYEYELFFCFNDTATTEIYTLSLHDALPISFLPGRVVLQDFTGVPCVVDLAAMRSAMARMGGDPRSEEHTLNSSHANISYAVFCLKKKKYYYPAQHYPYHSVTFIIPLITNLN